MYYIFSFSLIWFTILYSGIKGRVVDKQLQSLVIEYDDIYCGGSSCSHTSFKRSERNPFCRECSCLTECFRKQNCCPSQAFQLYGIYRDDDKRGCITSDISGRSNYAVPHYSLIDKCPKAYPNNSWRKGCENITEVTPISLIPCMAWSRYTAPDFYRNIWCAGCNNVDEIQPFSVRVTCNSSEIILDTESETELFYKAINDSNCHFETIDVQRPAIRCYPNDKNLIRSCNETGLWKKRDVMIEMGCELNIYKVPVKDKYYNIFCYICNTNKTFDELILEQADIPKEVPKYPEAYLDNLPQTLAKKRQQKASPLVCFPGYFNANKMERCVNITCPDSRHFDGIICETPLLSNVYGYEVCVEIEVTGTDIFTARMNLSHQVLTISSAIMELIDYNTKSIEGFDMEHWNCSGVSSYKQQFKFYFYSHTPIKLDYFDVFFYEQLENVTIKMPNYCGEIVTDRCVVERLNNTAQNISTSSTSSNFYNHVTFIPLTRLTSCCHVNLNSSDFEMNNDKDIYIFNSKQYLGMNDYLLHDDGSVSVCLSDFLIEETVICNNIVFPQFGGLPEPKPSSSWLRSGESEYDQNTSSTLSDLQYDVTVTAITQQDWKMDFTTKTDFLFGKPNVEHNLSSIPHNFSSPEFANSVWSMHNLQIDVYLSYIIYIALFSY